MGRFLQNAVWIAVTVLATAVPATVVANSTEHRIGPSMLVGRVTSQPIGHYVFCRTHRDECQAEREGAPSRVTDYGWSVVRKINAEVNRDILPMTDSEIYGEEEVWSYPDAMGDCEDYVLLKRALLIERGFPTSDLLITVVRKRNGEGHAVLTLRTDEGDYVLDNLDDDVRLWTDTPYTYLKRQASFHAGRWVNIENGDELTVGSIPN